MAHRYGLIVVGTGAGGGTVAHALATSGQRLLMLDTFRPLAPLTSLTSCST